MRRSHVAPVSVQLGKTVAFGKQILDSARVADIVLVTQSLGILGRRRLRLANLLRGEFLAGPEVLIEAPDARQRPRLQPFAKGLIDRLWYGAGSRRSARWAGENGFNLLVGSLSSGEQSSDLFETQLALLRIYRQHFAATRPPRIALGRVIVPLDSADAKTRQGYRDYAAARHARTLAPQGERRTLYGRDLVGTSDEILIWLLADPVLAEVDELRLELPYGFSLEQYQQILSDVAERIAPELGWRAR